MVNSTGATAMKLTKSKQFLADAIHASGRGWPDDADFATQDKDMWICLYDGKPTRRGNAWKEEGDCLYKLGFSSDKLSPNWHQTVLSREEYFSAYPAEPAADADGWIDHDGIGVPVGCGTLVDVRLRGNGVVNGLSFTSSDSWAHMGGALDIIAYRLHKPESKPASNTPEPEAKPTIERLAQDYRNKQDHANRKQQEADDAKAAADAARWELVVAGEAIGLVISVAKPEPELVIADWRQLQENDWIWYGGDDEQPAGEYRVLGIEVPDYEGYRTVLVDTIGDDHWIDTAEEWRFIRRP
jgi:hypothetical protein